MSQEAVWVGVILAALVLLIAIKRLRARREQHGEQVRYLIHSANAGASAALGATEGLQVTRYYFRQTDIATGPPEPDVFYDEFFVDLMEPSSGQKWQNSMFVCTPKGLERAMREEHWDTVVGTELLIVRKYDLDTILRGALDHLEEIYEVRAQLLKGPGTHGSNMLL